RSRRGRVLRPDRARRGLRSGGPGEHPGTEHHHEHHGDDQHDVAADHDDLVDHEHDEGDHHDDQHDVAADHDDLVDHEHDEGDHHDDPNDEHDHDDAPLPRAGEVFSLTAGGWRPSRHP